MSGMRDDSSAATWGRVWRYEGPRGVSWRIRYRDASGRRVLETLGKEPAWNRKRAEAELRKRLVDVEREGYRKPEKLTFAAFAERWLSEYLPARGLKRTTVNSYEAALRCHLLPYFGRYLLTDLEQSPEIVDRYVARKMQEGLRPKTVSNQIVLLQLMLKRAVRWRLMHSQSGRGLRTAARRAVRDERPHRGRDRPPLERLREPRAGSSSRGARLVADRAHAHVRRARNRHAPRRAPRPSLARRAPPRGSPARARGARRGPLHDPEVARLPPPARTRPANGGAPRQTLAARRHSKERTSSSSATHSSGRRSTRASSPAATSARRSSGPGSRSPSDPSTTSATRRSRTRPPPETRWPTSSSRRATHKDRSPSATSTPPRFSFRAPRNAERQGSSRPRPSGEASRSG